MTVIAIGVNHRTAPAELLDQLSFPADDVPLVLKEVLSSEVVNEAVVLSTCNRTEFYVHAERFHDGFTDVRDVMGRLTGVRPDRFDPYLYVHYHTEAVRHLFEVAAGLDSLVLGEHEILGQVGRSWEQARLEGAAGPLLNLLFQRALEAGKKVRTDTDIGRATASLSQAAITLLAQRRSLVDARVLLVGAGELGADVVTALCRKHPVALTVANRTASRAEEVAAGLGAAVVPFDQLDAQLGRSDVVICATGAPDPVVSCDALAAAVAAAGRQLLVVDLAQPRDVPVEAAGLPRIDLIELAEVQAQANVGLEARQTHVGAARAVIEVELDRYQAASSARQAAPMIAGLHGWADGIRAGELDRYAAKLALMTEGDRATVEAISRSIVAKILHPPTVALRDAAGTARGDRLADAVRELFQQ